MIFTYILGACQKQYMKISPKVIDTQEGYNKNVHEDHWTK